MGSVEAFAPVELEEVHDARQGQWFRELVGRYHPQGYTVAYSDESDHPFRGKATSQLDASLSCPPGLEVVGLRLPEVIIPFAP